MALTFNKLFNYVNSNFEVIIFCISMRNKNNVPIAHNNENVSVSNMGRKISISNQININRN